WVGGASHPTCLPSSMAEQRSCKASIGVRFPGEASILFHRGTTMLQIETKLDLIDLLAKAEKLPYKRDDSGALMAYPQSVRIPPDSPFQSAIKEIALIRGLEPLFLTINILPPGVIVPIHTDTLIGKVEAERW